MFIHRRHSVAVHPRWRGEHLTSLVDLRKFGGSSPLARGTRALTGDRWVGERFIPAGAGNTLLPSSICVNSAVHPRWRGEHSAKVIIRVLIRGSSPLARGTPDLVWNPILTVRFIPAGAGNTGAHLQQMLDDSVHPRWRGEHSRNSERHGYYLGSSPLARGTPDRGFPARPGRRFIPAGAGNTIAIPCRSQSSAVHPRWRGEHEAISLRTCSSYGSSPLARGTRLYCVSSRDPNRFIPAGAGNTPSCLSSQHQRSVHPRWRGEHVHCLAGCICHGGSSPLARGTLIQCRNTGTILRFIPAGAGNTDGGGQPSSAAAVHPRWRGEHRRE